MGNQTEFGEYTLSPQEQVRQFVTRVWEHPLVDNQTREHRKLAKTKLQFILEQFGVDPSTYITIPVGSVIWATDKDSDFDYHLVLKDMTVLDSVDKESLKVRLEEEKVNIVTLYDLESACSDRVNLIVLLLTPDDYIGGNIQIVQDLRLKAVSYLKEQVVGVNTYEDPEETINQYFDLFFRNWSDESSFLARSFRRGKPSDRNRSARISSRLEQRAQQTHNPERYKATFEKARNELRVPDLDMYSKAMINTQGALNLSPQHVAVGIQQYF